MDFKFIFFIFISIILTIGSFYRYYSTRQEIGAFIIAAGLIAASVVFGLRWFTPQGSLKETYGKWPPTINYCPDFLTLHTVKSGSTTTHYCVDTIGVTMGGSGAGLVKFNGTPDTTSYNNVFRLRTNLSELENGKTRLQSLIEECKAKGLTWEGVYNGVEALTTEDPPRPGP